MQSYLQIICQFWSAFDNQIQIYHGCFKRSIFNAIDRMLVLYSKYSVIYLNLWEVWLKIDLLEFKILYLCWDFFLQRSGSNLYYIIQQKRGF